MVDRISNFGFANSGVSQQSYLAGVIQGEAGTPEGQFAVASTIYNRANIGGFPGSDNGVIGVASAGTGTNVPQFSGYNPNYSPGAYNLAGAAMNGTLSQYGNPGNATFYNAKGTNAAYDAAGYTIGGNSYSDRYQQTPSSNFQPPQYAGAPTNQPPTPTSTSEPYDPYAANPTGLDAPNASPDTGSQFRTIAGPYDNSGFPGSGSDVGPYAFGGSGGTSAPSSPGYTATSANPSENTPDNPNGSIELSPITVTPNTTSGTPSPTPVDGTYSVEGGPSPQSASGGADLFANNPFSGAPSSGTQPPFGLSGPNGVTPSSSPSAVTPTTPPGSITPGTVATPGAGGGGGAPVMITNAPTQGVQAGSEVQQGIQSAGSQVSSAVQSASQTAASAVSGFAQGLFSSGTDWLVRGGLILLAVILILGAFMLFTSDQKSNVEVVPIPA